MVEAQDGPVALTTYQRTVFSNIGSGIRMT
jgi:hypothetical protein